MGKKKYTIHDTYKSEPPKNTELERRISLMNIPPVPVRELEKYSNKFRRDTYEQEVEIREAQKREKELMNKRLLSLVKKPTKLDEKVPDLSQIPVSSQSPEVVQTPSGLIGTKTVRAKLREIK